MSHFKVTTAPRAAAGALHASCSRSHFLGVAVRRPGSSGLVRSPPLGTALQRQPRIVSPGAEGHESGRAAAGERRGARLLQVACSARPLPRVLALLKPPLERQDMADSPLSPTRATNLAGTRRDHAGCLRPVRSTLATDFLLGLTCLRSKSPPSEEQILPLPSPQPCGMTRCCLNTHAVISFKRMH